MAERFRVVYRLVGDEAAARERARDICLEQTVEVEEALVPPGMIRDHVVGRIEDLERVGPEHCEVTISYAAEITAFELGQLLNVMFGNSSIKGGIRVERLELCESLRTRFRGPRWGVRGLRERVGALDRPLLCTALKPMGTSPGDLADMAYRFARGGIDVIKDDHGLTDQPFCPYRERVVACAEAVSRANSETGGRAVYAPNVTSRAGELTALARFAREAGAGALLVAPGLVGFDSMRLIADDDAVGLPIISHPALLGSHVVAVDAGISHACLFGQLQRLAGADASVYPNYGGRFGFSREECRSIAQACREESGHFAPIFPTPGGGMDLGRVPDMLDLYGNDVMFLMGGALYARSPDLEANARYFRGLVEGPQNSMRPLGAG